MLDDTYLPARFTRFEKVTITNGRMGACFAGRRGTIIWCDPPNRKTRDGAWLPWLYIVSFAAPNDFRSFVESDLQTTGEFDTEHAHLGLRHEISYDTVPDDDMVFVEGTFRLPGRFWQIFAFSNEDVPEIRHQFGISESGIVSIGFGVPRKICIDHRLIVEAMSEVFEAGSWVVVRGPDSMVLR